MKKPINLETCKFSAKISLDDKGRINDGANGKFGYLVFYTVPKEEVVATELFNDVPDNFVEGELEFAVDADLNPFGEVLLWTSLKNEDGSYTNDEFVKYNLNDITSLANKFKEQEANS